MTVGHESDIAMAQKAIAAVGLSTSVLHFDEDLSTCLNEHDASNNCTDIFLLAAPATHGSTYSDVLHKAPLGSTVYIFENSVSALEQGIFLFGDNIPRFGTGMASTIIGRDILLSLNLPKWSSTLAKDPPETVNSQGDFAQQNQAMMNPWINLVTERDFSELLTARIVSALEPR